MSDGKLRFAVVGCGTIAPTHVEAILTRAQLGAEAVACCDIDIERCAQFATKYSLCSLTWRELLVASDIDAVSICTPSGLHSDLAVACLRAGKHVVVEKPLDITLAACDRLIVAQRETGKVLACICQHRYDPATVFVRDALVAGRLGKPLLIEARVAWYRTQEYYDSAAWRGTQALDGGGCLMNQGVHTVDIMLWLCGRPTSVYAQCRTAAHRGIEVEDSVVATISFENGAIGSVVASTAAYPGFPVRLAIHGERGSAVLEGDALQSFAVMGEEPYVNYELAGHAASVATGGTRSVTGPPRAFGGAGRDEASPDSMAGDAGYPSVPAKWGDSHAEQLAEFIQCCRSGRQPLVDAFEGRRAVEVVLAVYQSARTGVAVTLPLEG